MTAVSDRHLYHLYRDLGDVQAARGRIAVAADAYALALYYARRMDDADLIGQCQKLVGEHNPNHVAAQPISAPLFFAQLLMRYPSEDAEKTLTQLRRDAETVITTASAPSAFAGDYPPFTTGYEDPTAVDFPDASSPTTPQPRKEPMTTKPLFDSESPSVSEKAAEESVRHVPEVSLNFRPSLPEPDQFEQHHVFDLGSGEIGSRAQSLRVTEEFLHPHSHAAESRPEQDWSEAAMAIHFAAVCAIVVGLTAIGFFTAQLYPSFSKERFQRIVKTLIAEPAEEPADESLAVGESASGAVAPIPITIDEMPRTAGTVFNNAAAGRDEAVRLTGKDDAPSRR